MNDLNSALGDIARLREQLAAILHHASKGTSHDQG
jgi:hypothetical protein